MLSDSIVMWNPRPQTDRTLLPRLRYSSHVSPSQRGAKSRHLMRVASHPIKIYRIEKALLEQAKMNLALYLRTQISLWPSGRLASRRPSARLEPPLKRLADWISWHQKVWAPNAENEMNVSRIFKNLDFRNFNFQKFYVHSIHQI
jgi:hypothetical protein